MPNRQVNLTRRVLTPAGKRYCPVVISANGRVKPDYVLVDGREERHPEGAYYIEWYEDGKRFRQSVGKDASTAAARQHRQRQVLASKEAGIKVVEENTNGNGLLIHAINIYLDDTKLTKKAKTYAAYKTALDYFLECCKKQSVQELDRRDLLQYSAFLRDEKRQSPRSVYNKFENVMTFLKAQGIRGLVGKKDWPRFVEQEPEVYEHEELEQLFEACNPEERLWFEFLPPALPQVLLSNVDESRKLPRSPNANQTNSSAFFITNALLNGLSNRTSENCSSMKGGANYIASQFHVRDTQAYVRSSG